MPYAMEKFACSIKGMVEHLKSGGRLPCPPVTHGHILYDIIDTVVIIVVVVLVLLLLLLLLLATVVSVIP